MSTRLSSLSSGRGQGYQGVLTTLVYYPSDSARIPSEA